MGIFIGGKNKTLRPYQKIEKNNKKNNYHNLTFGIAYYYNIICARSTNSNCK